MKIVRVQYTTRKEFAQTNIENIERVASEVHTLGLQGISYNTCLESDGKTFMHFDQFETEADHAVLLELESFKHFSESLLASGLEQEPKLEILTAITELHYLR